MNKYWKYLRYVLRHKYYVARFLLEQREYLLALTHDISKLFPREFILGATAHKSDWSVDNRNYKSSHYRRNKHHWQYWVYLNDTGEMEAMAIPEKYLVEMLCDWSAVALVNSNYGDYRTYMVNWYSNNKDKMFLHKSSREFIEESLYGNS